MASLTGNPINTTYPGLLKTSDNAGLNPAGGAFKTIEDGLGNPTPLKLNEEEGSILSDNFTVADATGTNGFATTSTEMQYGGTHNFTGATVIGIGGGGGGTDNLFGFPWSANAQGYGATYAITSIPLVSNGFWAQAIDQNANTAIFSLLHVEPGVAINTFVNAFLGVTADDTYELAIYDTHPTGAPKDKVFTTTVNVIGANGDQYVETAVSFTPTSNRYWFAMQTANAGNSKIGMMPREVTASPFRTYGAWGASPVGVIAVNSLYYNSGTLPASLTINQTYGHRDEVSVMLYKI